MKRFFDTNVLVCLFDADSPDKRRKARALFRKHAEAGDILLSTQVLQEFYVAVTRKLARAPIRSASGSRFRSSTPTSTSGPPASTTTRGSTTSRQSRPATATTGRSGAAICRPTTWPTRRHFPSPTSS
jgi:hypothetical protein